MILTHHGLHRFTQIVIQSEAKNLEYIKCMLSRSFLPLVVWMTNYLRKSVVQKK